MQDIYSRFSYEIERNPSETMRKLLVTLEINKIEAQYQRDDQPPIFRKTVDAIGLVDSFFIQPQYAGKVPRPKVIFSTEDYRGLQQMFHEVGDIRMEMNVMLGVSLGESEMYKTFPELYEKSALILRTVDEWGLVATYRGNPPPGLRIIPPKK